MSDVKGSAPKRGGDSESDQDSSVEPPPQHKLILFFLFVCTACNSCVSDNFKITRCYF